MDQAEWHQLMLERQQQLEEALERAEQGKAQPQDWELIRFECGVKKEKQHGINC